MMALILSSVRWQASRSRLASVALVLAFGVGLAGCAGNKAGYKKAERTGNLISAFRSDVVAIKDAVENTVVTLGDVAEQANTDPRKPYQRFSKTVDRLDAANTKAKKRADQMRSEGREFFAEWEQELASMQNEELKQLAAQRRQELDQAFRNISRVMVELKDAFRPWVADVEDLRTALGRDLTVSGINAVRGVTTKVQTQANDVQRALDALVNELNSVEALMTPAK